MSAVYRRYKEVAMTEKELGLLEQVWSQMAEWEGLWDGWKSGVFSTISVRLPQP